MEKNNNRFSWPLKLLVLLIFTVIIAELLLRLFLGGSHFTPPVFKSTGKNEYALLANATSHVYQFGREIVISTDKEEKRLTSGKTPRPDAPRLHLIGDSQVFGWGLNDDETIASQMQSITDRWQVVNHGIPGTAPSDYIKLARTLPESEPVVLFLTEENDLWGMYNFEKGASVDCQFLVGVNTGFLSYAPCLIKNTRVVQAIVWLLDNIIHHHRPTPIGFTSMSQAAAAPLVHRLNKSVADLRNERQGQVLTVLIPWKGRFAHEMQESYSPQPFERDEVPLLLEDELKVISLFKQQAQPDELYLEGDSHLSENGTRLIAGHIDQHIEKAL